MDNDNQPEKPSQVDAEPGTGAPRKPDPEPGKTPGTAETEAQPDKPKPADERQG